MESPQLYNDALVQNKSIVSIHAFFYLVGCHLHIMRGNTLARSFQIRTLLRVKMVLFLI